MKNYVSGVPPSLSSAQKTEIRYITEFWNFIRTDDNPGSTTWEVLEKFERQVTDCLYNDPPEIDQAVSLTAQAMLLHNGKINF